MKMTPEQKIFVRLHRTLTDLNSGTGYPLQIRGKMTFTSAVAYEDPTLERELHRLDVTGEAPVPKDVQTTGSVDGSDTALAPATIEAHDIVSHTQPDTRSEESNGQVQASGDAVSQGAGYAHALIQVTFSNGTSLPLEVVWLNPQGQEQPYFVLQPGASYVQTSYATHVWRFKHEGRVLGTYTIGPQAMQKWTIE